MKRTDGTRFQTAAERERQRTRNDGGRYSEMLRCYGGCGRPVNIQGSYISHPLTDTLDAEGVGFGDLGLALCDRCGKAAHRPELQTVRAFRTFIAANEAKQTAKREAAVDEMLKREDEKITQIS